ncbi:MAG: ornithine cyclodeaminase family protein [Gammaproteobacteria bacterium]|nr:ornithine cyclodeaminase family protein [Gammaproteobacteria bacterium]
MRVLARRALEQALPMPRCIDAMAAAMRSVSAGETDVPLRSHLPITATDGSPRGKLVVMPGSAPGLGVFGLKIVSKYPRAADSPVGTHVGMVIVFDNEEGLPQGLLEGGTLTEIRTAAASALATRSLARSDASVLAILGTGAQAERHALALPEVRDIRVLRLWGRTRARTEALAARLKTQLNAAITVCETAEEAVRGADIVCTTTSSATPVLHGEWLDPGAHVNLVGAAVPTSAEADSRCLQRARIYVDSRSAAAAEAGELRQALSAGEITEEAVIGELGELLLERIPGRQTDADITLYKSLGMAAQDLAAARAAIDGAITHNIGFDLDLAELSP